MNIRWFEMPQGDRHTRPIPLQVLVVNTLSGHVHKRDVPVKAMWFDLPILCFTRGDDAARHLENYLAQCGEAHIVFWCKCLKDPKEDDWQVFAIRTKAVEEAGLYKFDERKPRWWTEAMQVESEKVKSAHDWVLAADGVDSTA